MPANPGVCTNCGENVFQCHKCRTINYDEKDPFLCNSCGFCKYALMFVVGFGRGGGVVGKGVRIGLYKRNFLTSLRGEEYEDYI